MPLPEQAADGPVLCWREGAIAHLRFNRPQALNAIDLATADGLQSACEQIAADPAVRVVWISGEGRAFMAGGDLAAMKPDPVTVCTALIARIHAALRVLARLDAPVVASVHGAVAGGGLGLVLGGADLIIAAENTRFAVAYPLIGASCDCATSWALPRIVGLHRALELALLGDPVDAAEALRLGLCNRVVPAPELETGTRRLVERLAAGPTRAYGRLRRLIRSSLTNTFDAQLDAETAGFSECAATNDFREGIDAFLGKRTPMFRGN